MLHLAAGFAYPGSPRAGAYHQGCAQGVAEFVAQQLHRFVESAAHGHGRAVVDTHAQAVRQCAGLLPVAGPDRAGEHQILDEFVAYLVQRVGGVEHQHPIALFGVRSGPAEEPVKTDGGLVEQGVAADVHHGIAGGCDVVEGMLVALCLRAVVCDIGFAFLFVLKHQAESRIHIVEILADMVDAGSPEHHPDSRRPDAVAYDARVLCPDAHAAGGGEYAIAASRRGLGVACHREIAGLGHVVHIQHDVHPNLPQRNHRGFVGRVLGALGDDVAQSHNILLDTGASCSAWGCGPLKLCKILRAQAGSLV